MAVKLGRNKQTNPISMMSNNQLGSYQGLKKDHVKIKKELLKRAR